MDAGKGEARGQRVELRRAGLCMLAIVACGALSSALVSCATRELADHPASGQGYLEASQLSDAASILGPPPPDGSGAKTGDVATYRATRALNGSERWVLAVRDADFGVGPMLAAFSCPLGVRLDPDRAPALYRLLGRVLEDSQRAEGAAKQSYKRPRPFVENGGTICVPPAEWLRSSYSYPSGHSTFSWTTALILDSLAPDRTSEILARARAYGESRVVCGVHYPSDVQAGRLVASAVFAKLAAQPAFQADLAAAKSELARLRAAGPAGLDDGECRVEAAAAANPVW